MKNVCQCPPAPANEVVALEPQAAASSSSTSLLAQHARQHESVSISPHHSTHNQPDYSQFQQGVSNLPPSLQNQAQVRSDDIWLAPPLEGDNGIGLSGVDNRLWFGNSTGMNMDGMGASTGEFLLHLCFLTLLPLLSHFHIAHTDSRRTRLIPGFNNNGMTAATSEYAMLDSMFAMDPVFPGLGNLDTLDQQFIPNWDNNNNNNDTNHTQNIQSQSQPVHPTSFPIQNQNKNQNQNIDMLATPTQLDAPGTPWSTWLQGTLQGQNQVPIPEEGLMGNGNGNGNGNGSGKKTMSSSEVYKKVVKP